MIKSFQAKFRYALCVSSFPAGAGLCVAAGYAIIAIALMKGSWMVCSRMTGPGILYNCYFLLSPSLLLQSLAAGLAASIVAYFLMKAGVERAKTYLDAPVQQD
jgi:hypothetical protein